MSASKIQTEIFQGRSAQQLVEEGQTLRRSIAEIHEKQEHILRLLHTQEMTLNQAGVELARLEKELAEAESELRGAFNSRAKD